MTYWSADVGPYLWHEFKRDHVTGDLQRIASGGHRLVRTLLSWDAFMPTPSVVDVSRLRDLETFLALAGEQSLQVVPVLFVQSIGDCVMLPAFAIDIDHPRPGVRVVTGGVVQPGGPRDVYTDPQMIEAQMLWLETMLSTFSGHPAIGWWDIGHDPATTVRPQRIAHFRDWAAQIVQPLRDRNETCALTLGADDVLTARGVRPAALASSVDIIGFAYDAQQPPAPDAVLDVGGSTFLLQLAQRLSGVDAVQMHLGVCEQDDAAVVAGCSEPAIAARYAADAVSALSESGCAGLFALQWSYPGERMTSSPPFDRVPRLSRRGVVDAAGKLTHFGESWTREIRRERERSAASPWPQQLDIEGFYANLPDSAQDLYVAWKDEREEHPAMLG